MASLSEADTSEKNRPVAAPKVLAARRPGDIEVEGLEEIAWTLQDEIVGEPAAPVSKNETKPIAEFVAAESSTSISTGKSYKVLTTKDPWFQNKFDLGLLEGALNHYALQGWAVRSMAHPMITGFSGGPKEELIIILER